MLNMLDEITPPSTFLRDTFFRNVIQFDSEHIDIDKIKGKRRIAAYTRPIDEGVTVEKRGFTTVSYLAPYIKLRIASYAGEYFKRLAGENMYTSSSPAARALEQLARELQELIDMCTREEERQAAEALFTGKVSCRNDRGNTLQSVDFGLAATHNLTYTGDDKWNATAATKNSILEKLRQHRQVCVQDSGLMPTDIIAGTDSINAFIRKIDPDNEQSGLSSIRVTRGQIDPMLQPAGVIYWGHIIELGCDVWSYDELYTDLDGTTKTMVPVDKIVMLSRNARFDRNYAAIQNFKAGLAAVPRFPFSWEAEDGRARYLQIETAPLVAPHQVDSMMVIKVV
jgi:hypothetical protein